VPEAIDAAGRVSQVGYEKLVATHEKRIEVLEQENSALREENQKFKDKEIDDLKKRNKELEEESKKIKHPISGTQAVAQREDSITPGPAEQNKKVEKSHRETEGKASRAEQSFLEKEELMNQKIRDLEKQKQQLQVRCQLAEQSLTENIKENEKREREIAEMIQRVEDEQNLLTSKRQECVDADAVRFERLQAEHAQHIETNMAIVTLKQHGYSRQIESLKTEIKQIKRLNSKLDLPTSSHGDTSEIGTRSTKQELHDNLEKRVKEWNAQRDDCKDCFEDLETAEAKLREQETTARKAKLDERKGQHKAAKRILVEKSRGILVCLLALASDEPYPDLEVTPESVSTDGPPDSGYFGSRQPSISSDESFCWTCGEQWAVGLEERSPYSSAS
jgi:DNA repair exonuclease SbcCD ATPase subunit